MTDLTRILFVDDESHVLEALKRMLRPLRHQWDLQFAASARDALELLAKMSVQVVVSDMKMPGMDGATFLQQVMKHYPDTVRILLSGHSDRQMIMRALDCTHQYLVKPCQADELRQVIHRALELRQLLRRPQLQALVAQIDSLPSQPQLYQQVVSLMSNDNVNLEHIAQLIGRDPAMTGKILQLVNSSFFGLRRRISNVHQAISLLGLELLKHLILSAEVFTQLSSFSRDQVMLNQMWDHSLRTAAFAKALMFNQKHSVKDCDDAFSAGMMHDLGKLVLTTRLSDRYHKILSRARRSERPVHEVELEVLGVTHADIGAYLLGLWGLADPVVEAVAYHHRPKRCLEGLVTPMTVVYLANQMDHDKTAPDPSSGEMKINLQSLKNLHLNGGVDGLRDLYDNTFRQIA